MSLSNGTKEYWVKELKTQIKAKVDKILAENGHPGLLAEIQYEAERTCLERLGMTGRVAEMKECDQELSALEKRKDEIRAEQKQLAKQIASAIQGVPEDKVSVGFWGGDWDSGLSKLAKQEIFPELLNETPLGREVAELLKGIDSIERSIMLTTSPTNLRVFLVRFFDENNIDYEREIV